MTTANVSVVKSEQRIVMFEVTTTLAQAAPVVLNDVCLHCN